MGRGTKAHRVPSHNSKTVLSTVYVGGAEGSRTLDLLNAIEALSQLSYSPTPSLNYSKAVLLAQLPLIHYNYRTMRIQTNISSLLGPALLRRNDL